MRQLVNHVSGEDKVWGKDKVWTVWVQAHEVILKADYANSKKIYT